MLPKILLPKTQIIFPHNFAQKLQGFISVPYSILYFINIISHSFTLPFKIYLRSLLIVPEQKNLALLSTLRK